MTRPSWRGPSKLADALAANRARLGAESRRAANLRTVMAAWSPTSAEAGTWEAQARDLNALADRCGVFPQSNGAGPDD